MLERVQRAIMREAAQAEAGKALRVPRPVSLRTPDIVIAAKCRSRHRGRTAQRARPDVLMPAAIMIEQRRINRKSALASIQQADFNDLHLWVA
jgi:hypothetical protein